MTDFYGFDPSDWLDEGFTVELRFEQPLSDEVLRKLGRRGASFRTGELGYRFGGSFGVVELHPYPKRERDALYELRDVLMDCCGAELLEAVVLNSIDESEGARPTSPGPSLPGSTRAVDPDLPPIVVSKVLETAWREVVEEREAQKLSAFLAAAAEQPITLREVEIAEAEHPPVPDALLGVTWNRYLPGYGVWRRQSGPLPKLPSAGSYKIDRWAFVRGERALLLGSEMPRRHLQDHGPTELFLLEAGEPRHVYRSPDHDQGIVSAAWIDDARAVVSTHKRAVVVDLSDGSEVCSVQGGGAVAVAHGGRIVLQRGAALRVFGLYGDQLVPLARYEHGDLDIGAVVGDRASVRLGQRHWELDGVEEALASQKPKPKAKKASRKAKLALVPMAFEDLPADPVPTPLDAAELERFVSAGLDTQPRSQFVRPMRFRSGDVALGICAQGVAVCVGASVPRLLAYASASGYEWQLSRLRLMDKRVFATDSNLVVEADLDDEKLAPALNVLGRDIGHMKDIEPVDRDTLVVLTSKGLLVAERVDGTLTDRGFIKVTKPTHVRVAPELNQAIVGSEGKQRLILIDLAKPSKLAQFAEDANDLRLDEDGWVVADPRRELAWRITTA